MRLVKIKTPHGRGGDVAQVAFKAGISEVSMYTESVHKADGTQETRDAVDVATSTPKAKAFIDLLMAAPFYDPHKYPLHVRQPRSIVSHESAHELTTPIVPPSVDIFEDLWQYTHITFSFVGRVLIGAMLLSYGMIRFNLLFIISGLIFLPFLPLVLGVGFGLATREWRLMGRGAMAWLAGTALIVAGGAGVALMTGGPLKFQEFSSMGTSFLVSLAVGVAAGLATGDDVGRRALIGLAATAQIALLPAWFGISLVLGFPQLDATPPEQRILTFFVNIITIIAVSLCTYLLLGMNSRGLRHYTEQSGDKQGRSLLDTAKQA